MRRLFILSLLAVLHISMWGADPTATTYTRRQCEGTSMPYPVDINPRVCPDSLEAVFINHVGRHGARNPSSSRFVIATERLLAQADSMGTIPPQGKALLKLCRQIRARVGNQWGALDSLGMAEERAIASRMFLTFKDLLNSENPVVKAFSSYAPRCIMSMDEFTHQLARLNNRVELYTQSGRALSPELRFFDLDADYKEFISGDEWQQTYDAFETQTLQPEKIARRLLGERFPLQPGIALDFSKNLYKVISGCAAMGMMVGDSRQWLSDAEYNSLWACDNLKHYLAYSASTLSLEPAYMAAPLLENLISTFDQAVKSASSSPYDYPAAILRFAHAETLMPLFALLHLPGCYYMTNYFDTVGLHWRDFYMVPMGANLQIILFRARKSGEFYLRVDLNESPVPLIPGRSAIYTPWAAAREYMDRCLPLR